MSLLALYPSTTEGRGWWASLRASVRENSLLIVFTYIYSLAPVLVAIALNIHPRPYVNLWVAYVGFFISAGIGVFAAFALWYLYHARVRKVPNFQSVAWQRIRTDFLHPDRLMLALPIIVLWPVIASAFSYLKSVIPLMQPFYLDPLMHEWDRALHFGIDPWRLLQPLVGYTLITYVINLVYALWFLAFQAVLILQICATGDRRLRMQYLLTQALTWSLVGNLAAMLMSSAGPCFYGLLHAGPDPYGPLMAYLHDMPARMSFAVFGNDIQIPFGALVLQDMLWQGYTSHDFGFGRGISAAPSMHVASTWLMWRLAWHVGGKARIFGSLFLAFIFVGSIHLGWHYALDGYLGMAFAWLLWRLTGSLLARPAIRTWLWPEGLPGSSLARGTAAQAA
jgi:hypothetical protein